jgi:hypothetical protein
MNRHDLSIATITLARDPQEQHLLRGALPALAAFGQPVDVTDGGSPAAFVEFLRGIPAFDVRQSGDGLFRQVRQSLGSARTRATPFVLYTEPDKLAFFESGLAPFVDAADDDPGVGIVLPARSPASLATFPAFQQFTERTLNRSCAELTGVEADYSYGPFIVRRELIDELEGVPSDIGWGWRPFLFARAARRGLRIDTVAGEFVCPLEQRVDDRSERLHRLRQLRQNLDGLLLAVD